MVEILQADPRSVHWRQNRAALEYGFSLDTLNAVCRFDGTSAIVTQVQHVDLCDRSHVPAAGAARDGRAAGATLASQPEAPTLT